MDIHLANKIVEKCHNHYSNLPKKGKPISKKEWTLLSAVVMTLRGEIIVISMATGTKCLGIKTMTSRGDVVNDSHAEVLARRCFLRYIYDQIKIFKITGSSEIIIGCNNNLFKINPDARFHFYTSHVPCGDASIIPKLGKKRKIEHLNDTLDFNTTNPTDNQYFLTLFKHEVSNLNGTTKPISLTNDNKNVGSNKFMKDEKDGLFCHGITVNEEVNKNVPEDYEDIHRTGAKCLYGEDRKLPGTAYHTVGAVRTKPGRGHPTLSMSCSDKLAKWIACGIQGALLSLLLDKPIYLDSVVIGGGGPYSVDALKRALVERTQSYSTEPKIFHSSLIFPHSRYFSDPSSRPSPSAILYSRVTYKDLEVCVEGKRQGTTKKTLDNGRLMVCKMELLRIFLSLTGDIFSGMSYSAIKESAVKYKLAFAVVRSKLGAWSIKSKDYEQFLLS